MTTLTTKHTPEQQAVFRTGILVLIGLALSVALFWSYPFYYGVDWHETFFPVSQNIWQPYQVKTFVNPPWTAWILYPIGLFPERLALALNASLNAVLLSFLVIKRRGGPWALALTLTSVPFVLLIQNGGIEWIAALGLLLQNEWGLLMLATKPQSGFLAGLSWVLESKNNMKLFLPVALILVASFFVWGNWMRDLAANVQYVNNTYGMTWNLSPFPWLVPLGPILLFYIVKYRPADGEILGIAATLCLVPYFAVHSLAVFFALLSIQHRRIALLMWLLLWIYPLLALW